jgi:uncharacterized protein
MPSETYWTLYRLIETLPVVSSHEHHQTDDFQRQLTLNRMIEKSYVGWRGLLPGADPSSRAAFLAQCRHSSYYVWLEKGIQRVHGFSQKITADNWDEISARISRTHAANPAAHIDILRNVGRYRRAVQDTYWEYGSDIGHPELFAPTMRTDMFVRCFHPDVRDHDDNNPFGHYPDAPRSNFADYLDFLEALFTRWREAGAVTLKSASAYERSLAYGAGDRAAAAAIFGRPPETVSAQARTAFEEFMFNWFCELAVKLEVPFQIHTGLGQLAGSQPLLFESTIARYPQLHFVLFHMGYPWYHEIAGLAHNYRNVSIDMVWGPIISPSAAVAALHQYLEVARSSDLIAWGSDTWTSEDAVGALLAWQYVVATVLAQKVDDGYFDMAEAEVLAHKLMYRNAARIYEFDAR